MRVVSQAIWLGKNYWLDYKYKMERDPSIPKVHAHYPSVLLPHPLLTDGA